MGVRRQPWHVGFEWNLHRRGSRAFEVMGEVRIMEEPVRPDFMLLRKLDSSPQDDTSATTLRLLWPLLPRVTLLEYKSPTRAYRRGDLDRLWGYGHLHFANESALPRKRADGTPVDPDDNDAPEVWKRDDLYLVLAVPKRTKSLNEDVKGMGLGWEDLGGGYWKVTRGLFGLYVVELAVVGETEGDDLLRWLGDGEDEHITLAVRRFWAELVGSEDAGMSMQDMEEYDEVWRKFARKLPLDVRLDGLSPEQRLAGLPAEQRLADLDRAHQALALPLDVLRLLPESYFQSLPPDIQAELRRRLEHAAA